MSPQNILSMIQLKGSNLYVGNYIIPMHGRTKMHQLIVALLGKEDGLSRSGIRQFIYRNGDETHLSFRLIDSQGTSLSKLISRSRRYLKISLSDTPWARAIDWFVYDESKKVWRLTVVLDPPLPPATEVQIEERFALKAEQGALS